MPDNVYSSFLELLRTNTNISTQLADYKGIKAVFAHVQPEDSINMPSLTVISENDNILPSKYTEQLFLVNCFASNAVQAKYVSRVICGELDDRTFTELGVTMRFSCNGLTSLGDPTTNEFNSPVEVRVVYGDC